MSNKNAEKFIDIASEYVVKCGYEGKAVAYALMALAAELDELNNILDTIRAES